VTSPVPLAVTAESSLRRPLSTSPLDSILFYGTFGLLMFGPLAFGAVEPWSIWMMQTGAGLLFAFWATRQVTVGKLEIILNPLFLPMLLFAALVLMQLVTGRTAYRAETFSTSLLYCTYGVMSFLVVQSLRRRSQLRVLAWMFSGYGFTIAMLALVQSMASNGKLYWLRTAQSGGWIYGPYVNHNHYAGLMEILTPIPLVISFTRGVPRSHRAIAAAAAAVMASTIFLSGSRGGMVAFAVQMVVLAAFLTKRGKNWSAALALGGFLVIALGVLAWLGGGELLERIASFHTTTQAELSGGTRLTIDHDALRMLAQKPLLGWGLGVFPEIYPQFRSFPTNLIVDKAHNDYLQTLVEMGAFGFGAVLWFLGTLYRRALKNLRAWPPDANAALTLVALLGVSGILIHSFVDFNLQIPANAALFYVLCVVAAMEPRFGLIRHPRRHRHSAELSGDLSISATASIG
jgi:O-antigen ligase